MPKERERERALSAPRTTQAACTFTYVDYGSFALYARAWFCMMCTFVCPIPHVLVYPVWARNTSCTCIFTACINAGRRDVDAGRCRREEEARSALQWQIAAWDTLSPPPPGENPRNGAIKTSGGETEVEAHRRVNYRHENYWEGGRGEHLKYVAATFFTLLSLSFLQFFVFFLEFRWMCHGFTAVSFPDLYSLEKG